MAAYPMTMTFIPSGMLSGSDGLPEDLIERARALHYGEHRDLVQGRVSDGSPRVLCVDYPTGYVYVSRINGSNTSDVFEVYHFSPREGLRGPIPISHKLHEDLTGLFDEVRGSGIGFVSRLAR